VDFEMGRILRQSVTHLAVSADDIREAVRVLERYSERLSRAQSCASGGSMVDWTRRELLGTTLTGAGICLLGSGARDAAAAGPLAPELLSALEKSPFVYISPLAKNGSESRCHGEVWFAWDLDSIVIVTSKDAWKARALARGLDRARIWVADFGRIRWDAAEKLAAAPRFAARARVDSEPAAFDRVTPIYARKYPDEWASKWEARFKQGMADGSRVLIRYTPQQ
jgi:hypothetical protein